MAELGDDLSVTHDEAASEDTWTEGSTPHIESPSISGGWPDSQGEPAGENGWTSAAHQDDVIEEPRRIKSRFGRLGRPDGGFHMAAWLPARNLNTACVAMGAMVFGLMIWRADVVRAMPQTAAFFKMAGMGVNLRGLAIENVKITTEMVNNKPVLLIEGAILDVARKPLEIPRLRFIVRDARGVDLYAWNAVLEQPVLNPGDKAWFKTRLAAPPAEGREIAVRFFHKQDIASGGA